MKKALKRADKNIFHYKDGRFVEGAPEGVTGDLTDISGDLTDITGNIDDCEITDEDRKHGVTVKELLA